MGTAVPRSQGLGLGKKRFCMNGKSNRKEQVRKVVSAVLEIEARTQAGNPSAASAASRRLQEGSN